MTENIRRPSSGVGGMQGVEPGDEVEELEEEEEEEEEEEGENELVVLDPSHPLMQRVQAALGAQLARQNEKLEIELREKMEMLKGMKVERETLGVELYGIQQQLARQQMLVEQEQDKHTTLHQLRTQREETLARVREMYRGTQEQVKKERQQTSSMRHEVEGETARLRYLSEAHQTVRGDIALTKRATEKTTTDVSKAQNEKLQQDLYLDRLTFQVHDFEEQLALSDMQCSAQAQETKAVKEALTDATMELETILLEKKKLLQQWNSTLIGMRRRDEAYAAMLTAVSHQQQQLRSMDTEVENYKKSITKEQERNEQLTLMLNKVDADIAHVKRQIDVSTIRKEALKVEYMTYTHTLQETEQSLAKSTTDCTLKRNELGAIRTQTEREALEKRKLEDTVMEKMMQRLTMDKATQYTRKAIETVRKETEELDITVAGVDNDISQTLLQISYVTSRLKQLQQTLEEQRKTVQQQNELISHSDAEITRHNALIERKQTQIDQLNKKIGQKLSKMEGGEDLGPFEMKIDGLQKQIADSLEQCTQMQQFWLRQQNDLVQKTKVMDDQASAVDFLKKQLLILNQKKLRTDALITREKREHSMVEHGIASLQNDMVRLNTLITEKRGNQEKLQQGNILAENDFIYALKEAELESIQLQAQVEQLREEKERLLNSLLEAEHQIMLWEKKIQIGKEMKEAVDSEAGQAEVKAMNAEIHRMQVRYDQLMRQQEKMIQDMEKAVYRREAILLRGEAQAKSGKKEQTQGYLKKKISDMQRQIRQTTKDIARCEEEMREHQSSQQAVSGELEERQAHCLELRAALEALQAELLQAEESKKTGMAELLTGQAKLKYLNAAKEGKYHLLCKSRDVCEAEWQRQQDKLQSLRAIVEKLESDFPSCKDQLRYVSSSLKSRLVETQRHQKEIEEEMREHQSSQQAVSGELEERQIHCLELRAALEALQAELLQAEERKKTGMAELLTGQAKLKYLNAAKEGKYHLLCKSRDVCEAEWQRQQDKLQSLRAIVEKLESDFPSCKDQLRYVSSSLKSRLVETQRHQEIEVA